MDLVHAWLKETPLLAARPGISSERDVHEAVWKTLFPKYRSRYGKVAAEENVLSSHTRLDDFGRSPKAWEQFSAKKSGPDVKILGSKRRLDIIVIDPNNKKRTVGIEVKFVGGKKRTDGLARGIGQAHVSLLNRRSSILVLYCCKSVGEDDRAVFKKQWKKMGCSKRVHLVVRP